MNKKYICSNCGLLAIVGDATTKKIGKCPICGCDTLKEKDSVNYEVRIEFYNQTKEQREHLFNAEKELHKAGVKFDTGYSFPDKRRDWEFDWSLKGAKVKLKK